MSDDGLLAKWIARRDEYRKLGVLLNGERLCEEVLADLEALSRTETAEVLSLSEAAAISGYTREHLGRLVKQGRLKNVGHPGAPRVIRSDLPVKPKRLPDQGSSTHIAGASKRQIVRSVVDSERSTR